MDQTELQLKDIHLPTADIWPLALGWWLLLALLLVLSICLFFFIRRKLHIRKHKQIIFDEFSQIEKKLQNADQAAITETNILLRRLALAYYSDKKVASLTGKKWLTFLDESGNTDGFSRGAGRILIEAPYRSGKLKNYNGDEFVTLVHNWVKQISKKVGRCV